MFTITILEFIIVSLVISICASAIVGTLVFCSLKKKHDKDINWLFNMICNNKTEVSRFYEQYQDHLFECHKEKNKHETLD